MNHTLTKDPVCGMDVEVATAKHTYSVGGVDYHFCSAGCLQKFKANPDAYTNPAKPAASCCHTHGKPMPKAHTAANKEAIYTCPMHPEVRQSGPGNCPKCGMALEPETVTLEVAPNHELI